MPAVADLSRTVTTLERTLAADRVMGDAAAIDPRLHARSAKLRRHAGEALRELGTLLAAAPSGPVPQQLDSSVDGADLRHLTARLASYERRMAAVTYDAALVDLGEGG